MFFNLENPIPEEVRDKNKILLNFFKDHKVIPHYGTYERPSHRFLRLLEDLTQLSGAWRNILAARQRYTFGGKIRIVQRGVPGLEIEMEEVAPEQQVEFVEALGRIGLTLPAINRINRELDKHIEKCGNAWLRVRRVREGEATAWRWDVIHFLHAVYILSEDEGEEFIVYSRCLGDFETTIEEPEYKVYRVTPEGEELRWAEDEDGTEVAVMHLWGSEDNSAEGSYYNRSPQIGNLTWLYVDFQTGNHVSKVSAADFVTRVLLAIEGADPQTLRKIQSDDKFRDAFVEAGRVVREAYTSMSTKNNRLGPKEDQSVVELIEYPNGGKPPTAINLPVNADPKYLDWQDGKAVDKIAASLGWDVILTSYRQANANLGGNLLYDTFVLKNQETIKPRQRYFEQIWNGLISQSLEWQGMGEPFVSMGIEYPDTIAEILAEIKTTAPSQSMRQSVDDPNPEPEENELDYEE